METKVQGILLVLLLYQGVQAADYASQVSSLKEAITFGQLMTYPPSKLTEVKVGLTLFSIRALDSQEQILKATGTFNVRWNERLAWERSSYNNISSVHFKEGEVWQPELVVMNSLHTIGVLAAENLQYTLYDSGMMSWEPPAYFEVYCDMNLNFFPFDTQTCSIVLSAWTMTEAEMLVQKLSDSVNLDLYQPNSEWALTETRVEDSKTLTVVGNDTYSYSKVIFYITLSRHTPYYGLNVILPLLILSLLSTLVFILPAEGGEKASYSIFVMVAFFILIGVIMGFSPVSSETTVVAIYMTLILFVIASSTLCATIVINIHYSDPGQPMSAASRRVSNFLLSLTCKSTMSDKDSLADDLERSETVSTNITNSVVDNKSNGSLRNTQNWNMAAYPPRQLPPVDTIYKRNQVRPKSESSIKTAKTEALSVRELNAQTLKELADSLDRFFFIMFLIITILVNFIMSLVLTMGEP